MNYHFPAEISRPVVPGCEDTLPVAVIVYCDMSQDGGVEFIRAEVSSDARGDDGRIVYHRGEVSEFFDSLNRVQLNAAYLRNRQWDATDGVQEFPADDAQHFPDYEEAA